VLHPPRRDEEQAIDAAIERAEGIVELVAAGQFAQAMTRLHTTGKTPAAEAGTSKQ
jgi:peptidyl-tRNA hydrolase, PTH1 family